MMMMMLMMSAHNRCALVSQVSHSQVYCIITLHITQRSSCICKTKENLRKKQCSALNNPFSKASV